MNDKDMDKIVACLAGLVVGGQEIDGKVEPMRHLVKLVRQEGQSISSAEFETMLNKYSTIGEVFRSQLVRLFESMMIETQHFDSAARMG